MSAVSNSNAGTSTSVSRAPTLIEKYGDIFFRGATYLFAWLTVLLALYIVYTITKQALPAMSKYGWGFITSSTWDPNTKEYGVLPEIWGTMYSSLLALFIGSLFGLAVAI